MSQRAKTLTKFAIVFMSFVTIFGFRNIINNGYQFGLLASVLFLIGGAIYAIPMVMITSEFGSIKKLENQESGLGSFCTFSLGKKYGFLASWASYFGNLFFFATIAPFTVVAASFCIYGANGFDQITVILSQKGWGDNSARMSTTILALCSILIFWMGTFISKLGPKWIGKVTTIGGMASLGLGLLFIIIALVYTIPVKGVLSSFGQSGSLNPVKDYTDAGFKGDWWSFLSAFPWLIFAYNGIETMSAFIKDVKGGAKSFRFASVIGMSIVVALMVVGVVVLSATIEKADINSWGIANSYYKVFPKILGLEENSTMGKVIIHLVGFITAVSGFGSMFFWTSGPAKVFFSEVPEGVMGKYLSKTDKNGIPTNALKVQAVAVTLILILFGVTTAGQEVVSEQGREIVTNDFFNRITQATTSLATVQMFFYFWAYIWFRIKKNDEEREIVFFKNKWIPISISILTIGLLSIAFFFGTIPSPYAWKDNWVGALLDLLLIFGGFILFMGIGLLIWHLNVERKAKLGLTNDPSQTPAELETKKTTATISNEASVKVKSKTKVE